MQAKFDSETIFKHNRDFGYAGDVSAADAWNAIISDPATVLIDVRTPEEWQQIGVPELSSVSKKTVFLTWNKLGGENAADEFVADFAKQPFNKNNPLFLLCRGGGRSKAAAMALTGAGYNCCINVTGGFEGKDGWKASALPWHKE